jgi:MYND finger
VTYCLQIKCLLKMRRQQGLRPLFTPQEREDLENKLKIGVYDETVFQCGGCGKKDLEAGTYALLRKCEGCLKKWYCSKECQRNAWLLGHSTECKNTRASFDFNEFKSEGVMLSTAAAISLYNISVVESDDNQPMVIMYDEHCGMFFECLSDASMPAETSNAIVAKMEIMQENGGVSLNHLLDHSRQAAEETSRKPAISGEDVTKEESGS